MVTRGSARTRFPVGRANAALHEHNGEIQHSPGNLNWMRAAKGRGQQLVRRRPAQVVSGRRAGCSDSGSFDTSLEFLLIVGARCKNVMMMIRKRAENMTRCREQAAFTNTFVRDEPWDGRLRSRSRGATSAPCWTATGCGPAAITYPRDRVSHGQRSGCLPVDPKNIQQGRLQPGRMFL